jgi:hypothetical protein
MKTMTHERDPTNMSRVVIRTFRLLFFRVVVIPISPEFEAKFTQPLSSQHKSFPPNIGQIFAPILDHYYLTNTLHIGHIFGGGSENCFQNMKQRRITSN